MIISTREAFLGKRKLQDYAPKSGWIVASPVGVNGWTDEFLSLKKGDVDTENNKYVASKAIRVYDYTDIDFEITNAHAGYVGKQNSLYYYHPAEDVMMYVDDQALREDGAEEAIEKIKNKAEDVNFQVGEYIIKNDNI